MRNQRGWQLARARGRSPNYNRQKGQNNDGFTLLELLAVVIMIGVLSSIAAPGWVSYLNRQRVTSVRDELRAVMQDAQTRAQQKSSSYSVVFGANSAGPTAALSAPGGFPVVSNLGANVKNVQLSAFIGPAATTSTSMLTFDYQGNVDPDDLPFVVKVIADGNTDGQKCLIVTNLLGSIIDAKATECDSPDLGT